MPLTHAPRSAQWFLLATALALYASAALAQEPSPAPLTGPAGEPGLTLRYFECDVDTVLDLDSLDDYTETVVDAIALPEGARDDYFGLELFGAIDIAEAGEYTFYTTSDDGSRLYIGKSLVVQNDYPHGATEKSGAIALQAGRYPLYVAYFEGVVDQVLEVAWEGPGIEKGPIPSDRFTQHEKVVSFPRDAVSTTVLEWPELDVTLAVTVDTRDGQGLAQFHEVIPAVLQEHYPAMLDILAVEDMPLPEAIGFVVRPEIGAPAYASGGRIVLDEGWFTANPDDLGCFIHEMTHIVQAYRNTPRDAGWLVEGIADYVRHKIGADERWSIPTRFRDGMDYTRGYGDAAAFLIWIEDEYDVEVVPPVNEALKRGRYRADLFEERTGKTIEELWNEYQETGE